MRIHKHMLRAAVCALTFSVFIKPLSDNPYFPIFRDNWWWIFEQDSNFATDIFFISGHQAWDVTGRQITIPMLTGELDLQQLSQAVHILGLPDPMPTAWRGPGTIPIFIVGKLQGQGINFEWHQKIYEDIVAIGLQWYFVGLDNTQRFSVANGSEREMNAIVNLLLGPGDLDKLDEVRRQYFQEFGITGTSFSGSGFGDIDCYLQLGKTFDHDFKVRSLKLGGRLGVVAPTGHARENNVSGSIPFGGDGFWGGYVTIYAVAEVKEDFRLGCYLQLSKRFGDTRVIRVSVAGEPAIFGATVAPVHINPGMMVQLSPFIFMDNIREGFGLGFAYNYTQHRRDHLEDRRSEAEQKEFTLKLPEMSQKTKWTSSYITLSAYYDFGATKEVHGFEPIVSVRWDAPVEWTGVRQVVKAHKLSVGLDFVF
jgi:hypothetical protein